MNFCFSYFLSLAYVGFLTRPKRDPKIFLMEGAIDQEANLASPHEEDTATNKALAQLKQEEAQEEGPQSKYMLQWYIKVLS